MFEDEEIIKEEELAEDVRWEIITNPDGTTDVYADGVLQGHWEPYWNWIDGEVHERFIEA